MELAADCVKYASPDSPMGCTEAMLQHRGVVAHFLKGGACGGATIRDTTWTLDGMRAGHVMDLVRAHPFPFIANSDVTFVNVVVPALTFENDGVSHLCFSCPR